MHADHHQIASQYAGALGKGNTVTPCIFETFGGFERGQRCRPAQRTVQGRARQDAPRPGAPLVSPQLRPVDWSQLLSREVQLGVADEIIARTREEAAAIEAGNGRGA